MNQVSVTITYGVASSDNCEYEDQERIANILFENAKNCIDVSPESLRLKDGTYEVSLPPAVKVEQFQFNAGTWINRPKEDQFAPRSTKIRYRTVWRFVEEKEESKLVGYPTQEVESDKPNYCREVKMMTNGPPQYIVSMFINGEEWVRKPKETLETMPDEKLDKLIADVEAKFSSHESQEKLIEEFIQMWMSRPVPQAYEKVQKHFTISRNP